MITKEQLEHNLEVLGKIGIPIPLDLKELMRLALRGLAADGLVEELKEAMSAERTEAACKAYYDGYLSGVKVMENVRTRWMIDDFRNGYFCALNKLARFGAQTAEPSVPHANSVVAETK